jgi:hypothetical protein
LRIGDFSASACDETLRALAVRSTGDVNVEAVETVHRHRRPGQRRQR